MIEVWESLLAVAIIVALVLFGWTTYVSGKIGASFIKSWNGIPLGAILALTPLVALSPIITPLSFLRHLQFLGLAAPFFIIISYATVIVFFCFTGWLIGRAVHRARLRRAARASAIFLC